MLAIAGLVLLEKRKAGELKGKNHLWKATIVFEVKSAISLFKINTKYSKYSDARYAVESYVIFLTESWDF